MRYGSDTILPCVAIIKGNRMEDAFELYRSCVLRLESV